MMIDETAVPRLGGHWSIDLREVDHSTAMRSIELGLEEAQNYNVDAEVRSNCPNNGLNVLPPRCGDRHRRQAPNHSAVLSNQNDSSGPRRRD